MARSASLQERWPVLAAVPSAIAWLNMRADLGLADRTVDAYGRGLSEYLSFCAEAMADPLLAGREDVSRFVRDLTDRSSRHVRADAALASSNGPHLANATVQQRLTAVRLFYDHLVEEGLLAHQVTLFGRRIEQRDLVRFGQFLSSRHVRPLG